MLAMKNAWNDTFMAMSSIEFENYTKGVKRLPKDTPDYITDIKKRADDIRKNAKKTVQDMVSSIFRKENDDIKEEIKELIVQEKENKAYQIQFLSLKKLIAIKRGIKEL